MTSLTWTCHVCGEERPDAAIEVFARMGWIPLMGVPVEHRVRFCRDRERCRVGAREIEWIKGGTVRWLSNAVLEAFPTTDAQADLIRMVPDHLHEGIANYINEGRPFGDFLRAVFQNDLIRAAQRADAVNHDRLADIAMFVVWHCPSRAYGSVGNVSDWSAHKGMRGLEAARDAYRQAAGQAES